MHRRQVLAAAGTALTPLTAGCLDGVLGGPAGRGVALTDVGSVGEAHPLQLEVGLRSRTIGPEAARELAVTLQSTAEEELLLAYEESWPADGLLPDRNSDPRGLRLLAADEYGDVTVEFGDCPRTEYRPITTDLDGRGHVTPAPRSASVTARSAAPTR